MNRTFPTVDNFCNIFLILSFSHIANRQRDGDLGQFFSLENQNTTPSLSDFGKLRLGQKSAFLTCIDFGVQPKPTYQFDSNIFDGSAVVHFLPTAAAKTFADNANENFVPFLLQQLETQAELIVSGIDTLIAASRS